MFFSKPLTATAVSLLALCATVKATLAPSIPEPGTVWQAGKQYDVVWEEDAIAPTMAEGWNNFSIDLMTGENENQIFLQNIATNLSGVAAQSYKWVVPDVTPHSNIYFLMFTSENKEFAWTTRFAIVGEDGNSAPPRHLTQSNGEEIPWGRGKLEGKSGLAMALASSAPASSASSTASSVASAIDGELAAPSSAPSSIDSPSKGNANAGTGAGAALSQKTLSVAVSSATASSTNKQAKASTAPRTNKTDVSSAASSVALHVTALFISIGLGLSLL
ncbi:hypothetical protein BDF14DRAFT_584140 [Spinellus fusiger]|nr:hypothetical protein BDF14DRAFT_584140 [Spinellus fusiger]